jgi:hypothetical protein
MKIMEVLDYTEKSFVVIGDTKNVKDQLKELGGRYNPNLTHPETKEKLAAWVFSKKQKEKIQTFLNNPSLVVPKSISPKSSHTSDQSVDSLLDPIHRLGLRENGPDPPKKKRGVVAKKKESPSTLKVSNKMISEPYLISDDKTTPEFQEIPSFTMILPKVGMKVNLKNEDKQDLVLTITETHKNPDGYVLEFRAVGYRSKTDGTPRETSGSEHEEIVLDFVMVGKQWKRYTTEEPHWMNIV